MKFTQLFFFILFFSISSSARANGGGKSVESLWHAYAGNQNSDKKVHILYEIAEQYHYRGEAAAVDSVFDMMVDMAELRDTVLFNVYNSYIELAYDDLLSLNQKKALSYGDGMLAIARNFNSDKTWYESYMALSKLNMLIHKNELAEEYSNKAFYHVSLLNDEKLKAACMLQLGIIQEGEDKKIEAFRNYTDALYLAEKTEDEGLKAEAYNALSSFYFFLNKYDKAEGYMKMRLKLALHEKPVDSLELMVQNKLLLQILFRNHKVEQAERLAYNLISYANAHGYKVISSDVFKVYRTYLIDNGMLNELSDLYENKYPKELAEMAIYDRKQYYKLNAYIMEADGKMDSARMYYQLAETELRANGRSNYLMAYFFKSYAKFLLRRSETAEATKKMDSAYRYAVASNYYPYLIESTHYLDSLYYLQGNVGKAYEFASLNKEYGDRQAELDKGEEMLQIEVENEARQQELKVEREKEETERRHNLQYTGIIIVILSFFIILAMVGSFRMHKGFIHALGFISFIFFFEFIIMMADHQIEHITHGEPWKFMAIKVAIISFLLPLHHNLEKRVIHYLVNHKLVDASKVNLKTAFRRKKPVTVKEEADVETPA